MYKARNPHLLMMIDSLRGGGAERQFVETVNQINREKFNVSVCLISDTGIYLKFLQRGKLTHFFPLKKKNAWNFFPIILKINEIIHIVKPHIVHAWLPYSSLLINLASGYKRHYKIAASIRCSPQFFDHQGVVIKKLKRFTFDWPNKRSDIIFVNSQNAFHDFIKMGYPQDRLIFIPNGINYQHVWNAASCAYSDNLDKLVKGNITLVTAGRLDEGKGFIDLLKAMTTLIRIYPNIKLLIAGEGPLRIYLEKKIRFLHLENNIHLIGFREDIYPIIKRADIFVFFSHHEGMPNVIMEAMALGKAIVTTPVDGIAELIGHKKTGWLAPIGDSDSFATGIHTLIKNPQLREKLGKKARECILKIYTLEHIVMQYENAYRKFLD